MQKRVRQTYRSLYESTPNSKPIAAEYKTFSKAWGWYKIIADLADGQILVFDKITQLSVTEAFTFLQYRRDKSIAENAQRELEKRLNANRKHGNN